MNHLPVWVAAFVMAATASLFAALVLWPAASRADDPAKGGPGDPALIDAGKSLFSQHHCDNEFCHGPKGSGNMMGIPPGVKLSDAKWFHSDGSYEGIVKTITDGIPSSPMEPWGTRLGADRVKQVAAYVLSLSEGK